MKKKRSPYISTLKPYTESGLSKPPFQPYTCATNYAKVCAEYSDFSKDHYSSNITPMGRSISLNKPESKASPVTKVSVKESGKNPFGCTYFGQGFLKTQSNEGRVSPSPYLQQKSAGFRKMRINTMHKTANYWNIPSKGKSSTTSEYCTDTKKRPIPNPSQTSYAGTDMYLPVIEQKGSVHFTATPEPEINDTYIRFVSQSKKSRAMPAYANRSKEGEQGQIIPLDRKSTNPSMDESKSAVRAFNWEGIHFEVSPKQDGSYDLANNLQPEYASDMNLMSYNFNGSAQTPQRTGTESPQTELHSNKKISSMYNKTFNSFSKTWKRSTVVQSSASNYIKSIQKPKIPIDRIEEEPEALHRKSNNSPKHLRDSQVRLENEAKKCLERSSERSNGKSESKKYLNRSTERPEEKSSERRKKSPPPLTPITNNSNLLEYKLIQ